MFIVNQVIRDYVVYHLTMWLYLNRAKDTPREV